VAQKNGLYPCGIINGSGNHHDADWAACAGNDHGAQDGERGKAEGTAQFHRPGADRL